MDQQPQQMPQQPMPQAPQFPLPTEARLEPLGETWAPGVGAVSVAPGPRRWRWGVALGVVMIVALVTVAGAFVLSGAGGAAKSLTAASAPANTLMFLDVRTDLPGDQHGKLADFLSHFPGFKDRAQFDGAMDEMLNSVTKAISPDLMYTSAFKAWTSGEVSVAITSLGSAMSGSGSGSDSDSSSEGVLIVALKDRAAGEAWMSSEAQRTGLKFVPSQFDGTTVYTASNVAYAFTDKFFLAGSTGAVRAALDTATKGSLADAANYQAAMKSLSGDSLATFYMDLKTIMAQTLGSMSSTMGGGVVLSSMTGSMASLPAWMAGAVRADSDHMTVEMTMPKPAGAVSNPNHESILASQLPGSTVAVVELHSIGKLVNNELKTLSTAGAETSVKQVQDALASIGGIDWIGDTAVVATRTGTTYGGGLVVTSPDAATAVSKKSMITSLIALSSGGTGIQSTEETYKGATITVLTLPSTSGIAATVGIATKDNLLIAGYGTDFVKAMLDTTSGDSLAAQPGYQTALAAVGKSNTEYGYFDISAVADQIGQSLMASNPSRYNIDYKPYIDHIGGVAFGDVDGNTVTVRFVVTAK
jgi:hypothetical protein